MTRQDVLFVEMKLMRFFGVVVDGVTELWFVERSLRHRLLSAQGQALSGRMWGRLMPNKTNNMSRNNL